jgi:hypothetical protein
VVDVPSGYVYRLQGDYVGALRIAGTVAIKGPPNTPAARRVHLHDQVSGRFVAATWSAGNGAYSFERVTPGLYYLVSFDHTGQFNGVIESDVRPE